MDQNTLMSMFGGSIPPTPDYSQSQPQPSNEPEDCSRYLVQAMDKLQNLGVPFIGDMLHLLEKGGGSPRSWESLLKTIDSYGKHKDSVAADNIGNQ